MREVENSIKFLKEALAEYAVTTIKHRIYYFSFLKIDTLDSSSQYQTSEGYEAERKVALNLKLAPDIKGFSGGFELFRSWGSKNTKTKTKTLTNNGGKIKGVYLIVVSTKTNDGDDERFHKPIFQIIDTVLMDDIFERRDLTIISRLKKDYEEFGPNEITNIWNSLHDLNFIVFEDGVSRININNDTLEDDDDVSFIRYNEEKEVINQIASARWHEKDTSFLSDRRSFNISTKN